MIHVTYKISINQLFMLPEWLLVNSRLLVVKIQGRQKLYADFQLCREKAPLTPTMSKGQQYIPQSSLYPQKTLNTISRDSGVY